MTCASFVILKFCYFANNDISIYIDIKALTVQNYRSDPIHETILVWSPVHVIYVIQNDISGGIDKSPVSFDVFLYGSKTLTEVSDYIQLDIQISWLDRRSIFASRVFFCFLCVIRSFCILRQLRFPQLPR